MEISSGKRRVLTWVLGVLCATALVPGIAQATTSSAASATETAAVASAGTDATSSSSAASSASSDGTAPEPELSTPADLVGKELGVTAGGVYDQIVMDTVEGVDEGSFSYYENVSDSAAAVKSGKIDADIEFSATAELVVAQNEGLTIMPTPIVSDKIGICLKKDSPLTEKFNERLAAYRADGTLDRLHAEWMSADEESKSMPAQDWDAPNGTLRVICSTLEPMSYVGGNGEMRGYEPELMLYIARDLGYRVEFSNATFAGVIASVESGKVDVALGCISITEERREQMDNDRVRL